MKYFPHEDGITHINIYTRGKTELGRMLSNLYDCEFNVPRYGNFKSLEGFWYFYLTGATDDHFKTLGGFAAKQYGRKFAAMRIDEEATGPVGWQREVILDAIRCKLRQNRNILRLLAESTLPFAHYYVPKGKEWLAQSNIAKFEWQVVEFERLRKLLQERK